MASDTSWESWWSTDGVNDLWNRVEASAEADWKAVAETAEAGYNSLSRGVAELFPSGGLAHFQISQYFHGSYSNAAFEAPQAFLLRVVDEIKSSSWQGLESAANYIFGPTSVSLGIVYGLGESLAKDIWKLLGLAKLICLANLYAHLDSHSVLGSSDPLVWALANALDQIPGVHSEMKMAHDRMQELLRDLQEIVKHPKAFFQAVGKDISQEFQEDWKALTTYCQHPSLRHGFQLGKAVGRILYQLIMLLLIFEGAVKTATSIAAEFPRLARVARVVEDGGKLADLEVPERMAAGGASAGDEISADLARVKETLPFKGTLRGEEVELKGVEAKRITYVKRDPVEAAALRREFDTKIRSGFLKYLATDSDRITEMRAAGLSDRQIQAMANYGKTPAGWNVHHKLPLDDGGTNSFDNLVLIQNEPYHKTITVAQKALTGKLAPGESTNIEFPIPPGYVYPPTPEMGQ